MDLHQLYNLHTAFVAAFLGFAIVFVIAHVRRS